MTVSASASSTHSWLRPAANRLDQQKGRFGFYVHIPFCASRCGYCDFNTYTASELGAGVSRETYAQQVIAEIVAARKNFDIAPRVETVFFGGGTPTLLPAADLGDILTAIDDNFGLATDAEVTTEANPESVDLEYLRQLHSCGFTRLSLGMQSTARHVLRVLERQHTPQRALDAVGWARRAGFDHVSLDLIYGTPGEASEDFAHTLQAAIDTGVDHVSAYSLIVEEGTALARRVRRGEVPQPDDDLAADRYLVADQLLSEAGFTWYEVSNWAKTEGDQCRHNMLYWQGGHWWGAGPGAHSSLPGVRWWNVKHPARYAERLRESFLPVEGHETLTVDDQYLEEIMLRTRLFAGLPVSSLREHSVTTAHGIVNDGLVDPRAFQQGTIRLTLRGRLLADAVVRDLTGLPHNPPVPREGTTLCATVPRLRAPHLPAAACWLRLPRSPSPLPAPPTNPPMLEVREQPKKRLRRPNPLQNLKTIVFVLPMSGIPSWGPPLTIYRPTMALTSSRTSSRN